MESACRHPSLGIIFTSEPTALAKSWTRENVLSASLSFKRGGSQKSHGARSGLHGGWGKIWICLSFKIPSYGPCFVGTGIVVEKENVLGGGDWTLAVDLLDDCGQRSFSIISTCDDAFSRQDINCHGPLVVEIYGKILFLL